MAPPKLFTGSAAFLAILLATHYFVDVKFWLLLGRNAFMSNIPEVPPRRYPDAKIEDLVRDITLVVSAKDFLSPAFETLKALNGKVPRDIKILFTYPKPVIETTESFIGTLKAHEGDLTNVEYLELPPFANPFLGWVVAANKVQTKYIFFMHNDVHILEVQCLSELWHALEENLSYGVAAPHIYESDGEGRLVAHAISTNLHLRKKKNSDIQYLSHEVNPLSAVLRHPNDFQQKEQRDFLEDHGLMMRTYLAPSIIDPHAAFTMEYMDMQLMLRYANTTVLYVPSARVEFRPWGQNVEWRDLLFFVYRRSERLARGTKQYLEEKWGVEFPNTGFCNFVKFSVLRHFMLRKDEGQIPAEWAPQAALVASWFEFVGFNQFQVHTGEVVDLPHIVADTVNVTLLHQPVTAIRAVVPNHKVQPTAARMPLAGMGVLPLLKRPKNMETRARFELLSFGVVHKEFTTELEMEPYLPYCGLVVKHITGSYSCHMYVSPFNYDNLVSDFLEWLHWRVRVAPRVAVYYAMRGNKDLNKLRWRIYAVAAASNATAMVCGENEPACRLEFSMAPTDELLQISARVNSWSTVRLALIGNEKWWLETKGLFIFVMAAVALLYSDRMTRRCMQGTAIALGCFWFFNSCTLYRITMVAIVGYVLHLPVAKPRYARLTLALCAGWLVGNGFLTLYQQNALFMVAMVALGLHRAYKLGLTLMASAPPSLFFKIISNLYPAVSYDRELFFRADGASDEVAALREKSFDNLSKSWNKKFAKSYEYAEELAKGFSDLRFANGNRVFPPFNKVLNEAFKPVTVVTKADRMYLHDVDGNALLDIGGSYGVNVCGYDQYKKFLQEAQEQVGDLGCVLGPIHPLVLDNINRLRKVSGKEEVSFHMSGTEAVMGAVRLARFNNNKQLVVLFGGAYHGWWDGMQTAAGNEREVPDCLTLKDLNPLSLTVIRARAAEIAAIIINPLQSFHPNSPPPSDLVLLSNSRQAKESNAYKPWLVKLRKLCDECDITLIYDEVYTGFRLAKGGAQEYFGVQADMVVYGKTLGGGLPIGVVCSSSRLMNRSDPTRPMRVAYVIGTFAAHPWVMASMNAFLRWLETEAATEAYAVMSETIAKWCIEMNDALEKEDLPLRVTSYASVWTMLYQKPGRYHWMLQYYLRDEGLNLSWVGTGRLNFSLDFTPADFEATKQGLLRACRRMLADGWWADQHASSFQIARQFLGQVIASRLRALFC